MVMKMIICLGNFGSKYELTRHNIGFIFADNFVLKYGASFKFESKLRSEIAQFFVNGDKIIVVKPQTYMNLSGEALSLVKNFYKIENKDILVVYDDLSLPLGKIRYRDKGSDGGHNGLKSIIQNIGDITFDRLKLGIGPQPQFLKSEVFVLQKFSSEQLDLVSFSMPRFIEAVDFYLKTEDFKLCQSKYNG